MAARISAALSALVFAMLMANASATLWGLGGLKCKLFWWKCRTPVVHNPVVVVKPPVIVVNPPTTCGRVDIPLNTQCTTASGSPCSKCLGKCCLSDGYCPTAKCNDGQSDVNYCYSNSPFFHQWGSYEKSNCLGNLGYRCTGGSILGQARGVCVPFYRDCGKSSHWGFFRSFTFGSFTPSTHCLGYISCSDGSCGNWHGAPCIYQGYSTLSQLDWCANDFEVCSCPLTYNLWG